MVSVSSMTSGPRRSEPERSAIGSADRGELEREPPERQRAGQGGEHAGAVARFASERPANCRSPPTRPSTATPPSVGTTARRSASGTGSHCACTSAVAGAPGVIVPSTVALRPSEPNSAAEPRRRMGSVERRLRQRQVDPWPTVNPIGGWRRAVADDDGAVPQSDRGDEERRSRHGRRNPCFRGRGRAAGGCRDGPRAQWRQRGDVPPGGVVIQYHGGRIDYHGAQAPLAARRIEQRDRDDRRRRAQEVAAAEARVVADAEIGDPRTAAAAQRHADAGERHRTADGLAGPGRELVAVRDQEVVQSRQRIGDRGRADHQHRGAEQQPAPHGLSTARR